MKKSVSNLKISTNILPMMNIYFTIIVEICIIVYVSYIIYYLNTLDKCQCYKDKAVSNYSNITYLKVIEYIIITFASIFLICLVIFVLYMNMSVKSGGAKTLNNVITSLYIALGILVIIYIFFIYYVYKLSQNIDPNCPCCISNC